METKLTWRFGFNCYFSISVHEDRGDVHLEQELCLQLLIFSFSFLSHSLLSHPSSLSFSNTDFNHLPNATFPNTINNANLPAPRKRLISNDTNFSPRDSNSVFTQFAGLKVLLPGIIELRTTHLVLHKITRQRANQCERDNSFPRFALLALFKRVKSASPTTDFRAMILSSVTILCFEVSE